MYNQITDIPDWFAEYCMLVAQVDALDQVSVSDANALWELNQQ